MQERLFTVAWVYVERTTGDQNLSRALHYGVSHSTCCFGTSNQTKSINQPINQVPTRIVNRANRMMHSVCTDNCGFDGHCCVS